MPQCTDAKERGHPVIGGDMNTGTPLLLGLCAFVAATQPALAQGWPEKPVRLVIPFPPGGINDITARNLNTRLPAILGQNLIIDYRAGAGGNVGAEHVAKAAPDGYTILVANNSLLSNASLYRKLAYDPFRDFVPVAMGSTAPSMISVHPSLPARNIKELVALAKARPGVITYGSAGAGTPTHLAGELFRARTGANILHVPYKGGGPLIIALVGGEVMISFNSPITARPHVAAGKLRALAVTTAKRWSGMPELPTVAEAGYAGFDSFAWIAFFAPAGTPRAIVERLNAAINRVQQLPEIRERFAEQGMEPGSGTLDEFAAFLKSNFELWDKLIKAQHIEID
jgi:tripartite-type tricarboxylate transporter receptor subunit TctC